jgi:hypothetical protein
VRPAAVASTRCRDDGSLEMPQAARVPGRSEARRANWPSARASRSRPRGQGRRRGRATRSATSSRPTRPAAKPGQGAAPDVRVLRYARFFETEALARADHAAVRRPRWPASTSAKRWSSSTTAPTPRPTTSRR